MEAHYLLTPNQRKALFDLMIYIARIIALFLASLIAKELSGRV